MSRILRLIRAAVLATNRLPLLGRLNRVPYRLAVRALASKVSSISGVTALLARGSFARDSWIPGRSDIDLTAVIRSGLTPEANLAAARMVRAEVDGLRPLYPMIGELEILSAAHVAAYATPGWRREDVSRWKLLWGEPLAVSRVAVFEEPLVQALYVYSHISRAHLRDASNQTLRRAVAKIIRGICPDGLDAIPSHLDRAGWIAHVLPLLHRAASAAAVDCPFDARTIMLHQPECRIERVPVAPALAGHWHCFSGGVGAPWEPASPFLLIREDLGPERIAEAARAAFEAYERPILMTGSVFSAFLQKAEPLVGAALLTGRTAVGDHDVAPSLRFPSRDEFHRAVSAHVASSFPGIYAEPPRQGEELHHFLFGWLLRALRYFEDGSLDFDYRSLEQYMERTGRCVRTAESEQAGFALLHEVAGSLAAAMSRSQTM